MPRLAHVRPLPSELVTPPVTKMCFTGNPGRPLPPLWKFVIDLPVSSRRGLPGRNGRAPHESLVVRGRVDARRRTSSDEHADRPAVLERAKLLELLGLFERRLRQTRELEKRLAAVRVDADV